LEYPGARGVDFSGHNLLHFLAILKEINYGKKGFHDFLVWAGWCLTGKSRLERHMNGKSPADLAMKSSWFPAIDRNPQRYAANIFEAGDGDFIKAKGTVHLRRLIYGGGAAGNEVIPQLRIIPAISL
jgi:hypothetical protein